MERPAYFPIIWPKHIRLVIVIFFFSVLWTHCLAKSLWGSLNRLCFPSGESIQVTDTESWLQSKWPLKSGKCVPIWHLTISDVAADYKTQFSPPALGYPPICFLHLSPEKMNKCWEIHKDGSLGVLWLYINMKKGQAADELMSHVQVGEGVASCFCFTVYTDSFKWS